MHKIFLLLKCGSSRYFSTGSLVVFEERGEPRRITENYYEKKRKEYRVEQKKINGKIAKLHFANEEYYLTSEYLLKLASKASKLFESSEMKEKRLLLKMTLQNLKLKGRKVGYTWIKTFDKISFYASRQAWLPAHKLTLTLRKIDSTL